MASEPIDFNLIYRDKARPAFARVAEAAERAAASWDRAAAATTELADTVRSLDDPEPDSPELYPPYDGDGEPV